MEHSKRFLIPALFLISLFCKSQNREVQFETKLITAFMQQEEADSNIISEDYDTISLGYYFMPHTCRVYKYANKQLLKACRIDTPYFRRFELDRGATISIYPDITPDTINLSFTYFNLAIQSGYISFKSDFSTIGSWCNHKLKDSLFRYYADFRKDSAYKLGLRKKYYDKFDYSGFTGLNRKTLVKLLGNPDRIEMDTIKGETSLSNSSFLYDIDYRERKEENGGSYTKYELWFIISNDYIINPNRTPYFQQIIGGAWVY